MQQNPYVIKLESKEGSKLANYTGESIHLLDVIIKRMGGRPKIAYQMLAFVRQQTICFVSALF